MSKQYRPSNRGKICDRTIEIAYFDAPPELSTGASDAGLTLLADGDLVATFSNLDDLDVTIVSLVTA